jgi:hypothetical protein
MDRESKVEFWLKFVLYQFIGIWGITFSATVVTELAFGILLLFGKHYSREYFYWIVSGRPYFPVQIGLGISLGWVFGRYLWHRSMVWVWVLPFAYLSYAFAAIPTLTPNLLPTEFQAGGGESRISHYFGWGCGPWNHCIDQGAVTLPFYVAASYSIGAFLAHKSLARILLNTIVENVAIFVLGSWFFLAAALDLYYSTRSGWHWMLLPLESVPAGIGAFLMLLAFANWRDPRSTLLYSNQDTRMS